MDDLWIPPCPGAARGIVIPAAELHEVFSRSSGPGGQGVNTADSRVQLSLDIASTTALDDGQRRRVARLLARRLNDGILTITASEDRAQRRNRIIARDRLIELVRQGVAPDVLRRATKPTRGSQRRRLDTKRKRADIKQARRRPDW
ncbi:MAG: alternative ribosome rescue aminoacyl-tRNA hydrolase ArfB [Cumulibacter sp.]